MKRCLKSILLICLYLVFVIILFLPCKKIEIAIDGSISASAMRPVFTPTIVLKYVRFNSIKDSVSAYLAEEDELQRNVHNYRNTVRLYVQFIADAVTTEEATKLAHEQKVAQNKLEKAEIDLNMHHEGYPGAPTYYKIEIGVLLTIFAVLLLLGGFAYLVFCVVAKKENS